MKKLLSLLLTFLLVLSPVVLAEETSEEVEAGTTPDSPLWGLERAIERLSLLLTLGKAAKAKKGLMHARERLVEVKAMIEAKKLAQAEKAQEAHDDIMEEVEEDINEISEDPEQELEDEIEVEEELIEHDEELVELEESAEAQLGALTEEQQNEVDEVLDAIEENAQGVRDRIKAKREKTRIKLRTKLGMTEEEAEETEEEAEEEANVKDLRAKLVAIHTKRLERKIAKLRILATLAEEKGKDVSSLVQRLDDAESLLNQVEASPDKSVRELMEAVHEVNKLLNFRKVFIALKANNIEAKLAKLDVRAEATKAKAEAKLEAIERMRTKLQQRLTQTPTGDIVIVVPEEEEEVEEEVPIVEEEPEETEEETEQGSEQQIQNQAGQ